MITRTLVIALFLWSHQVLSSEITSIKSKSCDLRKRDAIPGTNKNTSDRISERKCKEYNSEVKCTAAANVGDPDKTYVEDASNVDFPHMALVLTKTAAGKYEIRCDGVLISPRFILTPAHCSELGDSGETLFVRLGDHVADISGGVNANRVELHIKDVYKHPDYTTPLAYHDIGLMELEQDVHFTEFIRPACLWTGTQLPTYEASVTSCTAYNRFSDNLETSKELQKFNTRVITNKECKAKGHLGIGDSQVCSVYRSGLNDTHCLKFAGAPLQLRTANNPCVAQVVGIASLGTIVCGDQPAVFARVFMYLDWIQGIVWFENK